MIASKMRTIQPEFHIYLFVICAVSKSISMGGKWSDRMMFEERTLPQRQLSSIELIMHKYWKWFSMLTDYDMYTGSNTHYGLMESWCMCVCVWERLSFAVGTLYQLYVVRTHTNIQRIYRSS